MAGTPTRLACALIAAAFAAAAFPAPAAGQEEDLVPPEIHVPADIVADATSALGAQVFFVVTATNNFAPAFLQCTGPSGGFFPAGKTTTVSCIAGDVSGWAAQAQFNVTVRPGAATNALTSATFQIVHSGLDFATQGDLIALLKVIATVPTVRKCDKQDETKDRLDRVNDKLGNRDTCLEKGVAEAQQNYTKYVQDAGKGKTPTISPALATQLLAAGQLLVTETLVGASSTPPVLKFAGDVTTQIPTPFWQAAGATSVLYTGPCNPPSGTQFPVGTTTITCTAQTTGGTTTGTFTVTVNPR